MESFNWNNANGSSTVDSCLWNEVGEHHYMASNNADSLGPVSSKLQDVKASNNIMDQQYYNFAPIVLEKSSMEGEAYNTWGDNALTAELCSSPWINMSPLCGLVPDFSKVDPLPLSADGSFESLDCLLSATNSNTDTSTTEDDGISMIFSDYKGLWNFSSGSTAVSSGESENNNNGSKEGKKGVLSDDQPDETVLQVPPNPLVEHSRSSSISSDSTRPKSCKRNKLEDQNYRYFDHLLSSNSGGFRLVSENPKRLRLEKRQKASNFNFQDPNSSFEEPDTEAIAQMKEMIYRAAAFRPVNLGVEVLERPKRKNVRISSDPQTVAARQRRERISERIRVLQRLVPGGSKMDTASMLDEAANYLKFLRSQVKVLESLRQNKHIDPLMSSSSSSTSSASTNLILPFSSTLPFNQNLPMHTFFPFPKP